MPQQRRHDNILCFSEQRSNSFSTNEEHTKTATANSPQSEYCSRCDNYHCALLLACKNDPKVKCIDSYLDANQSAIFEVDCEKKLPLHLACEYGASPAVLQKLLATNKKALLQKDANGMLPIHLACSSYFGKISRKLPKKLAERTLEEALSFLLSNQASALLEEDNNSMCPIEHAIEANLNLEIIHSLQKLSESIRSSKESRKKMNLKRFNSMCA